MRRSTRALLVLGIAFLSLPWGPAGPPGVAARASTPGPIRAAFFYPWFPENWHAADHYRPSAGWYSSDDPAVLDQQFAAMRYAGLDAAISSWWGPDQPTGRRLPAILDAAAAHKMSVAPYYEREFGDADPTSAQVRSDLESLLPLTTRPGWLHLGGKPVIFVYNAGATSCSDVAAWRAATHDWADFYVQMKVFPGFRNCPDQPASWHQYGPALDRQVQAPYAYNVSPGFWRYTEAAPRLPRDLARFKADLSAQVASGARWQLVTSFSEWSEGTSVESAREWRTPSGYGAYLDAMRQAYLGKPPAPARRVARPVASVSTAARTAPGWRSASTAGRLRVQISDWMPARS